MNQKKELSTKELRDETLSKKNQDDAMVYAIRCLNLLIARSNHEGLEKMKEILNDAKEELLYWAVEMDFYQDPKSKFINHYLFDNGLFAVADFVSRFSAIKDKNVRKELLDGMKDFASSLVPDKSGSECIETLLQAK
ncbi:MAG: hypothetical protein EB060_03160 [Proteobacteria bacterium]|nr:hypothetical protein [Pseudomonadota bacterium]